MIFTLNKMFFITDFVNFITKKSGGDKT